MNKSKSLGIRNKVTKLKTTKTRKSSSNKWLVRHLNDPFVSKAKIDGYRSRAAYKLLEINEKFKILKQGIKVLDLGAAPGGWSQIASQIIYKASSANGPNSIIAVDLLEMEMLPGVTFIKQDFFEEKATNIITDAAQGKIDVVLSDMAPNTIGHSKTDHLKIMDLCQKSFEFALKILNPGGHFVAKIFKGGTENNLLTQIKQNFSRVKHFKPESSRKESSELYIIALNRK